MSDDSVNLSAVRELMLNVFTADNLPRFLKDRPELAPIVDQIGAKSGLMGMIDEVLVYCESQLLLDELLAAIQDKNPGQYARYESSLRMGAGPKSPAEEPVYLRRIRIQNVRSIENLVWELPDDKLVGWHVIIGDNGSGKSTLLGAIALALLGETGAEALLEDWDRWLAQGQRRGRVGVELTCATSMEVAFVRLGDTVKFRQERGTRTEPGSWDAATGFFSAAYGPFRRFSGGDPESRSLFRSYPRLGAHLSVFKEDVALTEYLGWLMELQFKSYEQDPRADLLACLKTFINQEDFLPHQAYLEKITSDGVRFVDGEGHKLSIESLSDGYRSMLSMTFELIRQMARFYGPDHVFDKDDPEKVSAPGIVLIDEIDAHLHPTWQRQVGLWLRQHFPRVQFLVTTHSPLICQAADVGTVYRLPKPGSDEQSRMLTGIEHNRLVYGNVLDAYGTEAFGPDISRSKESQKRLKRLAELNLKEMRKGLEPEERREQQSLRSTMPTAAHTVPEGS
jgi:energy-coupling factor transporter ATP-binding protein EcfA2